MEATDLHVPNLDDITIMDALGGAVRPAEMVHRIRCLGVIAQGRTRRDVVGVRVRVDDERQTPMLPLESSQVVLHSIQHGIDQGHFTRLLRADHVGAAVAGVELSEQHLLSPL